MKRLASRILLAVWAVCLGGAAPPARAQAPTVGNLFVTTGDFHGEYTSDGVRLSWERVPHPDGFPSSSEKVRGIVVTGTGTVAIYNGTFRPWLSLRDPLCGAWSHRNHPEWSTANVGSHGNLAAYGPWVFATDQDTWRAEAAGLVRFDLEEGTSLRFAGDRSYRDVTLGGDGLLYATPSTHAAVDVYDPDTLERLETIQFDGGNLAGLAVDSDGTPYGASHGGLVMRFDRGGEVVQSEQLGTNLTDIDLAADGRVVVGTRFGYVLVTDRQLAHFESFRVGSDTVFVEVVEPWVASIPVVVGAPQRPAGPSPRVPPGPTAVYALGSACFHPETLQGTSLRFGPAGAPTLHDLGDPVRFAAHQADVDHDGFVDLVTHHDGAEAGLPLGESEACLRGETRDGIPVEGCDRVRHGPACGAGPELGVLLPWLAAARRRRARPRGR